MFGFEMDMKMKKEYLLMYLEQMGAGEGCGIKREFYFKNSVRNHQLFYVLRIEFV